MIKAIIFDFCRVLIFPRDESYYGELNALHEVLSENTEYNFNENFVFNNELLEFIKQSGMPLKYKLFLLTPGRIHETSESQRFLKNIFEAIFCCNDLKMKKNHPSTYLMLAEKINFEPGEILFVDNNRENTIAAETAGLQTVTFRNNMQFETEIEGYIK